jgi:hypothetical protein
MNNEQILKSMGYRFMKDNKWGKPVGWHLFVVEIDLLRWTNWFIGNNQKLLIWDSETLEKSYHEDFMMFLKNCETHTKIYTITNNSKFEFLNTQEQYELML